MVALRRARCRGCASASASDLARATTSPATTSSPCAVRLLDRGFFRIGTEDYAVDQRDLRPGDDAQVALPRATATSCSSTTRPSRGKRRIQAVIDPEVAGVIDALKRRRGGGDELLAFKDGRALGRRPLTRHQRVPQGRVTGADVTAKDFRTWGATVLAAVALAVTEPPRPKTARKRAISRAVKEVAHYLGNTPAVARASYIDPRVFDRYRDGETIDRRAAPAGSRRRAGTAIQGPIEKAVLGCWRPV